jgi:hypothetical protein
VPVCNTCGVNGHTQYKCNAKKPEAAKNGTFSQMVVSFCSNSKNTGEKEEYDPKLDPDLQEYICEIQINQHSAVKTLRDSGATYDFVRSQFVESGDYLGKYIVVKMPLGGILKHLPVANVVAKGDFGEVSTEAAVSAELCFDLVLGNSIR